MLTVIKKQNNIKKEKKKKNRLCITGYKDTRKPNVHTYSLFMSTELSLKHGTIKETEMSTAVSSQRHFTLLSMTQTSRRTTPATVYSIIIIISIFGFGLIKEGKVVTYNPAAGDSKASSQGGQL